LEAGLAQALLRLGLPGLITPTKHELRQKILNLRFDADNPQDQREITEYCFADCDGCAALYRHLEGRVPPDVMGHSGEDLKAVARIELRGVPFDVALFHRVQSMRPAIKAMLIGDVNATWPVFEGESFKRRNFLCWCRSVGIDWPVAQGGRTHQTYHRFDND